MIEFYFKAQDFNDDFPIIQAETYQEALIFVQSIYPGYKFELIKSFCLDCQ